MAKKKAFLEIDKQCPHCKKAILIVVDRISTNPVYDVEITPGQADLYDELKEKKEEKKKAKGKKKEVKL